MKYVCCGLVSTCVVHVSISFCRRWRLRQKSRRKHVLAVSVLEMDLSAWVGGCCRREGARGFITWFDHTKRGVGATATAG